MILQFLQIFLTDALTFMSFLQFNRSVGAASAANAGLKALLLPQLTSPPVVTQVGLLHHAFVLVTHGMRLHL